MTSAATEKQATPVNAQTEPTESYDAWRERVARETRERFDELLVMLGVDPGKAEGIRKALDVVLTRVRTGEESAP